MLKIVSRSRSEVGRIASEAGPLRARPRKRPPTILTDQPSRAAVARPLRAGAPRARAFRAGPPRTGAARPLRALAEAAAAGSTARAVLARSAAEGPLAVLAEPAPRATLLPIPSGTGALVALSVGG